MCRSSSPSYDADYTSRHQKLPEQHIGNASKFIHHSLNMFTCSSFCKLGWVGKEAQKNH